MHLKGKFRFRKRYWFEALAVLALLFVFLAPSFDRREEAVAILKSGYYIIGNGVLVGIEREGKPRVALVTCRHIIEARMLTTGRSFLSRPSEENRIYFNKAGWGFWYKGFGNIDPRRWHRAADKDLDLAWIVLTDDEVASFAGKDPQYYRLPEGVGDDKAEVIRTCDYLANRIDVGTQVKAVHLCAPVTGPEEPAEKSYWMTYLPMPYSAYMMGFVYGETCEILRFNTRAAITSIDATGRHVRPLAFTLFSLTSHCNMSGCPVFAEVDGVQKLLGILCVETADGNSGFQPLDGVLYDIRKSLENGK